MIQSNQEQILNNLKEVLRSRYKPAALYLYGSRAQGTARPDSDYDFVMVVDGFKPEQRLNEMMTLARDFHQLFGVQVQVWTYSPEEFKERLNDFGSIPETAVNTGREIAL